jgi:hypothetical protein
MRSIYPGNNYRTVVSYEITDDPVAMLNGEQFHVQAYQNNLFPQSPEYYVIKPFVPTITASGATGSIIHSSTIDNLVVVKGSNQGYHIFGESTDRINWKLNNGQLTSLGLLL